MAKDKAELLGLLRRAGRERRHGRRAIRKANEAARLLAPQARDKGATVKEIGDAYGITRAGVYVLMQGGNVENVER